MVSKYKSKSEVTKDVTKELASLNCKLISLDRISENKNDEYLWVVVAMREKPMYSDKPYIVWNYNSDGGGLFAGRYDLDKQMSCVVVKQRKIK